MIQRKLFALVISLATLFLSMLPAKALALGTATISLSGATNNNGNFAVTVYENSGVDTVTTAYIKLNFSTNVTNVSYDYSVGPFKNALPSGAYSTNGEVSGLQPVAIVRFRLSNPGSVTATVSDSSFLKHAIKDSNGYAIGSENFPLNRGSAVFTYTAPAQNQPNQNTPQNNTQGQPSASSTQNTANNQFNNTSERSAINMNTTTGSANGNVAGTETEAPTADNDQNDNTEQQTQTPTNTDLDTPNNSSVRIWAWVVPMVAAIAGTTYFANNRNKKSQPATTKKKTTKRKPVKKNA